MRGVGRSGKTTRNYHYLFESLERRCPGGIYSSDIGTELAKPGEYPPKYGRTRARVVEMKNAGNAVRATSPSMTALHCYLIRKTRAMDLYQAGVPLPLVAQLLGHESVSTTSGFYAFTTDSMMADALHAAAPAVPVGEAATPHTEHMKGHFSLR